MPPRPDPDKQNPDSYDRDATMSVMAFRYHHKWNLELSSLTIWNEFSFVLFCFVMMELGLAS